MNNNNNQPARITVKKPLNQNHNILLEWPNLAVVSELRGVFQLPELHARYATEALALHRVWFLVSRARPSHSTPTAF